MPGKLSDPESKTFESSFRQFTGDRLELIYSSIVLKDLEFRSCLNRMIRLHKDIAKFLGPEQRKLIDDYESCDGLCTAIQQETAYLVGLKDGMSLKQILDSVR